MGMRMRLTAQSGDRIDSVEANIWWQMSLTGLMLVVVGCAGCAAMCGDVRSGSAVRTGST